MLAIGMQGEIRSRRKAPTSDFILQSFSELSENGWNSPYIQNVTIWLEMPESYYAYIFWELFKVRYYHFITFNQDVLIIDKEKM